MNSFQVMLLLWVWRPDLENLKGKEEENKEGPSCGPEVAHTCYLDCISFCQHSVIWP